MGRPRRIRQYEYPYSISTRCNNREFLLQDEKVYKIFESIFEKLKSTPVSRTDLRPRYRFKVHHFILMSDHYHLSVSVDEGTPIDKLMQLINSLAARAINKLLGRSGHVWGERYYARIVDTMTYLKKTISYFYQNPKRAKTLRKDVEEFGRSTFRYYVEAWLPRWLYPDPFLESVPSYQWKTLLPELVRNTEPGL